MSINLLKPNLSKTKDLEVRADLIELEHMNVDTKRRILKYRGQTEHIRPWYKRLIRHLESVDYQAPPHDHWIHDD